MVKEEKTENSLSSSGVASSQPGKRVNEVEVLSSSLLARISKSKWGKEGESALE